MPNITQQIPNFLGGVSTQPDDQKEINTVRDVVNGYLDPTFGLVKRNGFVWKANLGSNSSTSLANGFWFFFKTVSNNYIICIANQRIYAWNADTGATCTVNDSNGSSTWTSSYLNNYDEGFTYLPLIKDSQDQVVIINRGVNVAPQSGSLTPGTAISTGTTVNTVADLPVPTTNNADVVYKIVNTGNADDDYYVKSDGTSWVEVAKPAISDGFNANSAPHRLRETATDTFVWEVIPWSTRTAGDLNTNPNPSFANNKIRAAFMAGNRLGFVSANNVILSKSNEYFDFFRTSALVLTDADPIDLICGSSRKVILNHAIAVTQGVVLFSERQQFLLFTDTGVYSPNTVTVKSISNFDVDESIPPVESGTSITLVNKAAGYCRVMTMITQGQNQNPLIFDIGKKVTQYIPSSINKCTSNAQNGLTVLYDQSSPKLYLYRDLIEGNQVLLRGWVSWELPGDIQFIDADNDVLYGVFKGDNEMVLCTSQVNTIPTGAQVAQGSIKDSNPSFDFIAEPKPVTGVTSGKEYVNGETRIYIPFDTITTATPIAVQDASVNSTFSGFYQQATLGTDSTKGDYFAIPGADLTDLEWLVGYSLDFEVELPTYYYRRETFTDVNAYLSIHRMKFSLGLSSQCDFMITPINQGEVSYEATTIRSNEYKFDKVPLDNRVVFTVPIMQRNISFTLKVTSNNPYIVSLNSVSWEGNYSPKYYGRA